tara:strand:- start:64 stop:582 length:519 start_codon:yes stop_codon:yes gene_type:complete
MNDLTLRNLEVGEIKNTVNMSGGHKKTVVLNGGATVVLTAADSGATCVFDTAGASNFTLPQPELGMHFTFISAITATSDHVIQCATNEHGFLGGVTFTQLTSTAADQCDSFSADTDGNNDFITLNGSTTGGVAGCFIHVAAILGTGAAKSWAVHGNLIGTGNTITPFGDSQI